MRLVPRNIAPNIISQLAVVAIGGSLLAGCEQRAAPQPVADEQYIVPETVQAPEPPPPPPPPPPAITAATLELTLEAEAVPRTPEPVFDSYQQRWLYPEPEQPPTLERSPRLGTGVTLSDGARKFRFSDSAQGRPTMSGPDEANRYRLTVRYSPIESDRLLGAPLTDLRTFKELTVDFSAVLAAHGLRYLGVRRVVLHVNGQEAFAIDDPEHVNADPNRLDLAGSFQEASAKFIPELPAD